MERSRRALFASAVLVGCAAVRIGVGCADPYGSSGPDRTPQVDAGSGSDASHATASDASAPCDETKLTTDPLNCGRCGHDCLGGECTDGKCRAIALAAIPNAPLRHVVSFGADLFVGTSAPAEAGGIWRVPKAGGSPEPYVQLRSADNFAVLGDALYFVVNDYAHDPSSGTTGGLWRCPVTGPAPCTPTLIAGADNPQGIAIDDGRVYYADHGSDPAIMVYEPPNAPTVFRGNYSPRQIRVEGQRVFYTVTYWPVLPDEQAVILWELPADGGAPVEWSRYRMPDAVEGDLIASPGAFYFAAHDENETAGGVVRRVPRPGGSVLPCDFGGSSNVRPNGIAIDEARVYWTNLGARTAPYGNGGVLTCSLAGCCTSPELLWSGQGAPAAIATDEKAVYFVMNKTGEVWKIAKP